MKSTIQKCLRYIEMGNWEELDQTIDQRPNRSLCLAILPAFLDCQNASEHVFKKMVQKGLIHLDDVASQKHGYTLLLLLIFTKQHWIDFCVEADPCVFSRRHFKHPVDNENNTYLHFAIRVQADMRIINLLVNEAKIDTRQKCKSGVRCIDEAIFLQYPTDTLKMLIVKDDEHNGIAFSTIRSLIQDHRDPEYINQIMRLGNFSVNEKEAGYCDSFLTTAVNSDNLDATLSILYQGGSLDINLVVQGCPVPRDGMVDKIRFRDQGSQLFLVKEMDSKFKTRIFEALLRAGSDPFSLDPSILHIELALINNWTMIDGDTEAAILFYNMGYVCEAMRVIIDLAKSGRERFWVYISLVIACIPKTIPASRYELEPLFCCTCRTDKVEDLWLCDGCRVVAYCSHACQKKGWINHKKFCQRKSNFDGRRKSEVNENVEIAKFHCFEV